MKKIMCLLILIAVIISAPARAQEVRLTLDEAVAIALRDNREMLFGAQEVEKAKYKISESQGALFPSLTLNMSEDVTQNLGPKPYKSSYIQAELKITVFDGFKNLNTIEYNRYSLDAKRSQLEKTRIETALNVKSAFATLVLARDFSGLNNKIMENAAAHLFSLEERYKTGEASESDILNIKSVFAKTKKDHGESLNQAEANAALLKNLLYLKEQVVIIPASEFLYEPQEVAYDKALLLALEKRPEIKEYEAQVKANKKAVSIAKAGYLPTISGAWDSYSGDKFLTATGGSLRKWQNYNVYGVSLSWPIFDGFATRARIEQAVTDLKGAQILKEKAAADIALELKNSYLTLKDAIAKLDSAEADLVFYNENLSGAKDRFSQGILSGLDLDDAELKYTIAEFNREQGIYDYIIARSRFDKAMGGV